MVRFGYVLRDLAATGFFGNGFFSYLITTSYEKVPEFFASTIEFAEAHLFPIISEHSSFVATGALIMTLISSINLFSNISLNAKTDLFRIASESKLPYDADVHDAVRHKMPKKFENIFVISEKRMNKNETHNMLDELFTDSNLTNPHYCVPTLVESLKSLNYHIAFHDHSEIFIKQRLIDMGWNFNVLNQAFLVIDMEICNEIGGAYFAASHEEIAKSMRTFKELAAKGYTQKKIENYLIDRGFEKSDINKVLSKIYKVQELHTTIRRSHERKIRRALRLNMIHPSKLTDGNYNS